MLFRSLLKIHVGAAQLHGSLLMELVQFRAGFSCGLAGFIGRRGMTIERNTCPCSHSIWQVRAAVSPPMECRNEPICLTAIRSYLESQKKRLQWTIPNAEVVIVPGTEVHLSSAASLKHDYVQQVIVAALQRRRACLGSISPYATIGQMALRIDPRSCEKAIFLSELRP